MHRLVHVIVLASASVRMPVHLLELNGSRHLSKPSGTSNNRHGGGELD